MKRLLLAALLLETIPVQSELTAIQCPGENTIEMRWCASQQWEESNQDLQDKLSPGALESWKRVTQKVCAEAYAPVKGGSIYPQMVIGCDDRLNRTLIEEFRRLGD